MNPVGFTAKPAWQASGQSSAVIEAGTNGNRLSPRQLVAHKGLVESIYVLAWELSNTMEAEFCIRAWEQALAEAGVAPLISNTDQGSQFTSPGFVDAVQSAGVEVSMDGRGRWIDNRFIERLCRLCRTRHKRHSYATHLLESGTDIRTLQETFRRG